MSDEGLYKEDDASKLAAELFSGKLAVGEALAKLRTRLLDLSMRNRLLNYRHPRGRSLQFVDDADLDLLFERLEEGKSVSIQPVSDPPVSRYVDGKKPDVRAYARDKGISISVDLQAVPGALTHRRLADLQVLLYPLDLEKVVRKVSSEARTVIEETGTNMLYLIFGYLEYFDSEDSDKPIHAPLLSMPVNLVRGRLDEESRTYLYEVSYSGEDLAENFSLREKMKQQFRLELPDLDEEDTPEEYFSKIRAAVANRPNWTVKRRLSLGFLSFGKLAIWADLDPSKSQSLLSSELLRNVFEGGRADSGGAFHAEDYDIDRHEDGELPLIYDADSSQHSALIDVMRGKSLVINGPPGTGKSQTITNIIASAIASGKKVLFVSEKLAALEVVKQRLEKAGLGDFCLELHSHKTQKKQLLESVEQRMTRQYAEPQGYDARVAVLRERKGVLNSYATLLGSKAGNQLNLSIHRVFWITERHRQALDKEADALAGFSVDGASEWDASRVDKCRIALGDVASALQELRHPPTESPWLGFSPKLLIKGDENPILRIVEEAMRHAQDAALRVAPLEPFFGLPHWTLQQLESALEAFETLRSLPVAPEGPLLERMFASGVTSVDKVASEVSRLAALLSQVRALSVRSAAGLAHPESIDVEELKNVAPRGKTILGKAALASTPAVLLASIARLAEYVDELEKLVRDGDVRCPWNIDQTLGKLEAVSNHPECASLMHRPRVDLIETAKASLQVANDVRRALQEIETVLSANHIPFTGRTEELQALMDGRGIPDLLPDAVIDEARVEELRPPMATPNCPTCGRSNCSRQDGWIMTIPG